MRASGFDAEQRGSQTVLTDMVAGLDLNLRDFWIMKIVALESSSRISDLMHSFSSRIERCPCVATIIRGWKAAV
jgi:hypothetical protein